MEYMHCAVMGYLIGTINPSYIIAKIKGFDIRKKGSGNAGASNALILFGKIMGIICALLDIAKAYLAILLMTSIYPNLKYAFAITAVGCVLGHIFPFYMGFKGGKGLACLGGMILFFDWRVFLIMLTLAIVLVLVTDYICFVPLAASATFPFVYGSMAKNLGGAAILLIVTTVIALKHIENLRRIANGTEMHLSYIWKPEKEMERMKEHLAEDDSVVEEHFSTIQK